MPVIMLNDEQQEILDILTRTRNGQICKQRASELLGITVRQVNRKLQALRENGFGSVIHGNTGKSNACKLDDAIVSQIIHLYTNEFTGWNFSHFKDALEDHYEIKVSLSTIRRILDSQDILSPQAHKHKAKSHPLRPRRDSAGELIQVDASDHAWLYGVEEKFSLHGGVDDATGRIVGCYLTEHETIYGYQVLLAQIIQDYGLPAALYADGRTVFFSGKKHLSLDEKLAGKTIKQTRYTQMLDSLDIKIAEAPSPQAKGRIERLWKTAQDRLVNELEFEKISSPDKANIYIQDVFVPKYNDKFALAIRDDHNVFRMVEDDFDYNSKLATYEERMVQKHCYISYNGQHLTIMEPTTNKPVYFNTTKPVPVYTFLDQSIQVFYHGKFYPTQDTTLESIRQTQDQKLVHQSLGKSHPVAPNHPWKKFRI